MLLRVLQRPELVLVGLVACEADVHDSRPVVDRPANPRGDVPGERAVAAGRDPHRHDRAVPAVASNPDAVVPECTDDRRDPGAVAEGVGGVGVIADDVPAGEDLRQVGHRR